MIAWFRAFRVFVVCLLLFVFDPCDLWIRFRNSREDAKWLFSHGGTGGTGDMLFVRGSTKDQEPGTGLAGRRALRSLGWQTPVRKNMVTCRDIRTDFTLADDADR
jgi:hypothetical protein